MPRFLIVDDDPAAVRGMTQLLTDDGHVVSPFTGGAAAVDALSRHSFDAVVTDLEMPYVDGHAVVRAARLHQPHACLIVATARAEESLAGLLHAGACIVADKPFEYGAVTREVVDCRSRGGPRLGGTCHMRARPHGHQLLPALPSRVPREGHEPRDK
jgi:CheY-like chemotaxis protein